MQSSSSSILHPVLCCVSAGSVRIQSCQMIRSVKSLDKKFILAILNFLIFFSVVFFALMDNMQWTANSRICHLFSVSFVTSKLSGWAKNAFLYIILSTISDFKSDLISSLKYLSPPI